MSDYGYRPAPPPEDGRSFGDAEHSGAARGSASPGNAAHGSAPSNPPNGNDYGWGGSGSQHQGTGSYGGSAAPPPRPGSYGTPASGSASVGRASGSASVGSASVGGGSGRASVGSASVGSASVGSASVGSASVGSASVGSASVGSASVGSVSVGSARPVSPAGPGRTSVAGKRRAGPDPLDEDELAEQKKLKKKHLRRKVYAGLIAMGVLFVAAVTVVGAWFFQEVELPADLRREGESSTFLYADGSTEAGGYGDQLRKLVDSRDEIPDTVIEALVSLEDRNFYEHGGVDYKGTMRALVNNVSGGDTQGASTITQQYAGMVAAIRDDISYGRKAKEAVMAMKLEQQYTKDQIVTHYLNLAYFGRGANGIAAAAEVYFDTPLMDLTYEQAAFIVMQVKSPNGAYDEFYGGDPTGRWNDAMSALLSEGYIDQAYYDAAEVPEPISDFENRGSWGGDTAVGFIVNEQDGYVFEELERRYGITKEMLRGAEGSGGEGGYQITLTLDSEIQKALERTNSRGDLKAETNDDGEYVDDEGTVVDSASQADKILTNEGYWQFENTNDEAALKEYEPYMTSAQVAIDPATGGVVGYYGGDDGFGIDKAGPESPHPPSSTFKLITAATAVQNDASIESWWDASSPRKFDSLTDDEGETCIGGGEYPDCTLRNGSAVNSNLDMTLTESVVKSKNTPMYAISEKYGASEILRYADDMGLNQMSQTRQLTDECGEQHDRSIVYKFHDDATYTMHGEAVDADGDWIVDSREFIAKETPLKLDGNNPVLDCDGRFYADEDGEADKRDIGGSGNTDPFYNHLAFGQYPTSVRDMAAMYATIANNGVHNETHFVAKVEDREGEPVPEQNPLKQKKALDVETARDLQFVASTIAGESSFEEFSRPYFGKTGTWEASGKNKDGEDYPSSYNAHAWYVGAIPQVSIATWVGNATKESDPIADPNGDKANVYGSNTAYPVWHAAMNRILESKQGDDGWGSQEWEGPIKKGSPITEDIENADGTIDPDSAYCQKNPDDTKCGVEEEEEEDENESCEQNGNGNGNQCESTDPTQPGEETPTDPVPGEEEPTCNELWPDDCDEPTDPGEEDGGTGGEETTEPTGPEDGG
ncbi:transglycosylase domain-containing protein [Glycomyces sp. L485]|uniref:transglycosylase domain-containing protein n=1 Tax=Glycomyces sp. L485 TaxID=2909235 RepID=UPI001F4A94EB|nr:transglycosylase domain-containing protein [Glycomyces sp. L485]MCH7229694.1 transglycosylase domain-containing protein [Glycomyces sp. L485]